MQNTGALSTRADDNAKVNEQSSDLGHRGFNTCRRNLLVSLIGATATTGLTWRHLLAATPTEGYELSTDSAAAPPIQATPRATPSDAHGSPEPEAQDVIAINFLLEPDAALAEAAKTLNARLRESYPAGYALDAAHAPHISVVQRFVRAGDLDVVSAALTGVLDAQQPLGWPLRVTGYEYVVLSGLAVMVIAIERSAELERLQQDAIAAIAPFTVERGTESSFVPSPDFDPGIIDYVATFVPKVTGENYRPHVTVGAAQEDIVKRIVAESFTPFTAQVAGAAIYQLGIFGTAAKRLWGWTPR